MRLVLIRILATHLLEALLFRTWFMIPTLVLCGVGELLGWGGRYWGHVSPTNGDAFLMQYVNRSSLSILSVLT
jgi:hypothetical protein